MEAPSSSDGKRCSWCGTLNSASDDSCSKCDAVLSSIQGTVVNDHTTPEALNQAKAEGNRIPDQTVVGALVDSSLFDKISGEAMSSFGLDPTFMSGQTRAFLVAGCFTLYVLISLVSIVVDTFQIGPSPKAPAVLRTQPAEVISGGVLMLLIRVSLAGVALLTAVSFLTWIYRAHENLKSLGATDLKYSPGWAIGGFFVPILNIVRPYQVVTEIWKASGSGVGRPGRTNWTYEKTPVFIGLWWGSWLILGFLRSFSTVLVLGAGEVNQLAVASRFLLVHDVISIVSAALAMTVVLKINARQEVAHRLRSSVDAQVDR